MATMTLPRSLPMKVRGGKTVNVPCPAFGTWTDRDDPIATVNGVASAIQAGCRHLDCAWEYNVDIPVGEGIRKSGVPREELFITHKLWPNFAAPENVETALDTALEQMGLEYVDLYLIHHPAALTPAGDLRHARMDAGRSPRDQGFETDEKGFYIADLKHCPAAVATLNGGQGSILPTWNAMKALVRSGKVRGIGVSNFTIEHLEEILNDPSDDGEIPLSCNQIEGHPWYPNQETLEFMHQRGILAMMYSPFAPLNWETKGTVIDFTPFTPYGTTLLKDPKVQHVAERNGLNTGQVLLSWAVQRGTIPIFRSTSARRQRENLQLNELSKEDMEVLNGMDLGDEGISTTKVVFPGVRCYD